MRIHHVVLLIINFTIIFNVEFIAVENILSTNHIVCLFKAKCYTKNDKSLYADT